MIIKIIPESDKEKETISEVEHKNVKEFFIFGNKKDSDGDLLDFHDWNGSYRFLLGSLGYFTTVISDERRTKEVPDGRVRVMPKIDASGLHPQHPKMVKHGIQEGRPQIIDVEPQIQPEPSEHEIHGVPETEQKAEPPDIKLL